MISAVVRMCVSGHSKEGMGRKKNSRPPGPEFGWMTMMADKRPAGWLGGLFSIKERVVVAWCLDVVE